MTSLAKQLVLVSTLAWCSTGQAEDPHHPLPKPEELRFLVDDKCAHLDAALTSSGASQRCAKQELAEFDHLQTLARDEFIPDLVWISCRQESGSMHTANFALWAKCLKVARAGCALESQYIGVGASYTPENRKVVVVRTFSGSPAEKVGLQKGDVVLAVAGESLNGLTFAQAMDRMRRPAGEEFTLTILRGDEQPRIFRLARAQIRVPNPNQMATMACVQMIQTGNWLYNRRVR